MGFNEWSDDEQPPTHVRDKFRPERSLERFDQDYIQKKRTRSPPEDQGQRKRRASPTRHYHRYRDYKKDVETEHYIPNYARDGYTPGPRYGKKPERSYQPMKSYPMMDMMNPPVMNWSQLPAVDPTQLDYLVPFRQFLEFTKRTANRRIEDEEMQQRYDEYKENFSIRQLATFFNTNKDRKWFQEKYHPTISLLRKSNVKARRLELLEEYLRGLEMGEYDKVCYDMNETKEEEEEEEEGDYDSRLVIKTVPPSIAREEIIQMCEKVEGFEYVALSDPSPTKKFHRIGWIKFKEGTDIQKAFEQLDNQKIDDFIFHLALNRKNSLQSRKVRTTPEITNTTKRLYKDLEQAKEIAVAFETELGKEGGLKAVETRISQLSTSHYKETDPERLNLKKKLDLIINYLKHVHMYCYYCAIECDSTEDLFRRCADTHCRTTTKLDLPTDPKALAKHERGVAQWVKSLDQKIQLKSHTIDEEKVQKLGGRLLQNEIDEYIKQHVLKENESKYKCQVGECSKAFKGFDYVEKHILAKHSDEMNRIKIETDYFNNYVCDPNHYVPNANVMPVVANIPYGQPMMMMPWFNEPPRRQQQAPRLSASIMDLENSLPRDPRQVTSYVDLDAPAEGDSHISFY